jgi:hypothetical protein
MEQRFQACSYYCGHKKDKLYLPNAVASGKSNRFSRKIKNRIKNYLIKTKSGFFVFSFFRRFRNKLYFPSIFHIHNRYYSNNNLGIFITTNCNLSCFNCQTSARQAPASDIMTIGQIKKILNEAINLRYYWNYIFLTGGEPTLHPQFFEILDALKEYKDFNPTCDIVLETNGAGNKVQAVLEKLPDWVLVAGSNKEENQNSYAFGTYNIAPIDTLRYRFSDFSKGCSRLNDCYGLCATMYGYYPCSPCMNVARVFGFDIGIKDLSLVNEKALREQMIILCKYCGWFKEWLGRVVSTEKVSPSWKRAFAEYRKQKPKMSLYNT